MDIFEKLFSDTLWIYTSILGALLGAAFLAYFKETRLGLWLYAQLDRFLDYLIDKYDWYWLEQPEDAWKTKYPKITKKISEIESRLQKLEGENNDTRN